MTGNAVEPCRILVVSASLRDESLNSRLAGVAVESIEAAGHAADFVSMREFDVGSYDGDAERANGFPAGAEEFGGGWRRPTRS